MARRGRIDARTAPRGGARAPRRERLPVPRRDPLAAAARLVTLGTLAAAVLLVVPGLLEQFEVPKTALVRIAGLATLAAAAVAARAAPIEGRRPRFVPLDFAVLAWIACEALATFSSVSPLLSVIGEPMQREGLATSLALAGMYVAARHATRDERSLDRMLDVWFIAVALASLYALAQVTGIDPMPWRRTSGLMGWLRPFGTLGHPNLLGAVTAAAFAPALARALAGPRRALHLAAAALFAITTLLTVSRGAWLAALAGAIVSLTLLVVARATIGRRVIVALGAAAAVLAAAVALLPGWFALLRGRALSILSPPSTASRVEIWRSALAAWRARPLLGQGPDTFELVFPRYQTPAYWRVEWAGLPLHAHSIYLHALATRGALGFLAGAAWAAALIVAAAAMWRGGAADAGAPDTAARARVAGVFGAIAALAVAGLFGAIGICGALLLVTLSGALATLSARDPAPASGAPRGGRAWRAIAAGVVAALVVAIVSQRELSASHRGAQARAWLLPAPREAVVMAREAQRLIPYEDLFARIVTEAAGAAAMDSAAADKPGLRAEATAAGERAVELQPRRELAHRMLARALTAQAANGDSALAKRAVQECRAALAISPDDALALIDRVRASLAAGDRADALEAARRAQSLYPGAAETHVAVAAVLLAEGRVPEAKRALLLARAADWHGDDAGRARVEALLAKLP